MRRFRRFLARNIAKLAMKIDPLCPEVIEFYSKQLLDLAITGGAMVRIDPSKLLAPEHKERH